MISWFVSPERVEAALSRETVLCVGDINCLSDVSTACLDENVNINRIRKYFDSVAWCKILRLMDDVRENGWLCRTCKRDVDVQNSQDSEAISIFCDGCLEWLHISCAGLRKAPKSKSWFCRKCK